jgi:hypothetical protein
MKIYLALGNYLTLQQEKIQRIAKKMKIRIMKTSTKI